LGVLLASSEHFENNPAIFEKNPGLFEKKSFIFASFLLL